MKRNFLKRSMALAVAAAVAASSLPTSFAFAEEEIVVEDAALDVVTEEEADAVVEEAAEAEAAVTAEPEEEEFVVGIETVEEGAEEAELNAGTPGTPAAVEGLTIKTVGEEGEILSAPELQWNYVPGAYGYKIVVTDAAGRTYGYWYGYPIIKSTEVEEYNPHVSIVYNMYAIEKTEDGYKPVYDAENKYIYAFAPGQTYTISVCAVNAYQAAEDAEIVYTDGPAASITYTAGAVVGAITDLSYVSEDDDCYYFTYGAAIAEGYVYYQISEKADFSEVYTSYDYPDEKKLDIDYNFEAGKTYYIRAVNSTTGDIKAETWKAANVVTLAVPAKAETTLKTITGLYLYKTNYYYDYDNESDRSYFEFRFDPVLEDGDVFVLQYSKDNVTWKNASSWPWDYYDGSPKLSMSLLEADTTYYVRAVTGSNWGYHEDDEGNNGSYGFETYGTPSNVVTVSKTAAISAISDLALLEKNSDGYKFTYTGSLHQNEAVEFWYSETPSFDNAVTETTTNDTIYYSDLTPGKTYYVRARVQSSEKQDSLTGSSRYLYGAFTNTVAITAEMPRVTVDTSGVTNTSLLLEMSATNNKQYLTGFQIQRKNKKKWATLTKTTDSSFKDTGLTKDTTYTYRVRPYYYDAKTAKTVYGAWDYEEAVTWGSALNLKATPKTKKSIALTWKKVKGAEGYEIYRYVTSSYSTQVKDGDSNYFNKYTLIKTVKKSKKSYVDKKLTPGVTYSYLVRAYKTVDGKKCYIQDGADASLAFGGTFTFDKVVENANGTVKVAWTPIIAADGYVIEQQDNTTGEWAVIAKKKASVATYTFPATTDPKGVTYRIRPYKGNEYMTEDNDSYYDYGNTVTVNPILAAPTGVAAKAAADGSVTVTWNPVAGADYYQVYRTTSSDVTYNVNLKTYFYKGVIRLHEYVADPAFKSGYKNNGCNIKGTSLVDRPITYTSNGVTNTVYAGPTAGVKYYYYVVAYKENSGNAYNYVDTYEGDGYKSGNSKAASATVTSTTATKKPVLKAKKIKSSKGKVTVQWKKVAGAQGYVIYRSEKKKSGYTIVGSVDKGSTLKYVDGSVTKGKTYYYKVKAVKYNEAGASVLSAFSKVKQIKAK